MTSGIPSWAPAAPSGGSRVFGSSPCPDAGEPRTRFSYEAAIRGEVAGDAAVVLHRGEERDLGIASRAALAVASALDDVELAAEAAGFTIELGAFSSPGTDEEESERITSGDGRSPAEWVLAQREERRHWFGRTPGPLAGRDSPQRDQSAASYCHSDVE